MTDVETPTEEKLENETFNSCTVCKKPGVDILPKGSFSS